MARTKLRARGDMYRVNLAGHPQELVTAASPKEAAERYLEKHKDSARAGVIGVRDSSGRGHTYFVRKERR